MQRYWDDIRNHGLLKKYFLLWGPVQCVTFSVVPERYRVTFIACVSFFWLIILSTIASKATVPVKASANNKIVDFDDGEDLDAEPVEYVPECELADGLTCNIDG